MERKYKTEIKTSGDFENDPQGALDALEHTGFALFMITKNWYTDLRAQKEWRFTKDMKKPMMYIITKDGIDGFREDMFTESLIGIVNDYGDTKKTTNYVQAIMAAYMKNLDDE